MNNISVKEIKYNLKNFIPLTNDEIEFIKNASNDEKNEIILLYNTMFLYVIEFIKYIDVTR
jgi:hypothetical protein